MNIQCKGDYLETIGLYLSYKNRLRDIQYRNFVRKCSRKHK